MWQGVGASTGCVSVLALKLVTVQNLLWRSWAPQLLKSKQKTCRFKQLASMYLWRDWKSICIAVLKSTKALVDEFSLLCNIDAVKQETQYKTQDINLLFSNLHASDRIHPTQFLNVFLPNRGEVQPLCAQVTQTPILLKVTNSPAVKKPADWEICKDRLSLGLVFICILQPKKYWPASGSLWHVGIVRSERQTRI